MRIKTYILTLFCIISYANLYAVDAPPKIKRVCLDISDSMAYVYWNIVNDPCASFTKYEIYGREDQFSIFQLLKTEANIATNNTNIKLPNRKRWQFFILVSNSCNGFNQFSSDTIFLDNEEPTQWQLDSISVDCKTQKIVASWSKHDTLDVEGYYIYNVSGGSNSLIGTENDLVYKGILEDPTLGPITHLISAFDSCKNASPLSVPSTTVFLSKSIDTCRNTLFFNWSHYIGWANIVNYQLHISTNSSPFIVANTVLGNTNTTSYKYAPGDTICAFIRAVNGDDNTVTSSSNKLCQTTNPLIKPNFLYINKVTIENHDTLKVYSIQDETKIDSMILQKRQPGGNWITIDNIKPVEATYTYTDEQVLVNQEEFEYQLIAYNTCRQTLDSSNISKNILLKLNNVKELEWTPYYTFDAGTEKYNIFNSADGSTWNTESSVIENSNGNALCFCILGIEQGVNSYGRIDTSYSNRVCAKGEFSFYVPNAFKPSGVNTVFLPNSKNIEEDGYKMTIISRWGEVFFTTYDINQGWDGTFQNSPCQMGAYVYLINAQGKDGTIVNTSGIINLIR